MTKIKKIIFISSILVLSSGVTVFLKSKEDKMKELSILQKPELLTTIKNHPNLQKLTIQCLENLKELPQDIGFLTELKELNMDGGNGCVMNAKLPESVGSLSKLEILNLFGAQDPEGNESLRVSLPESLANLDKLHELDLGRNGYVEVPFVTSKIKNLSILKLNFNDLSDLPSWISGSKITQISLVNNCQITTNLQKQEELKHRFPKVTFDFSNEYECEGEEEPDTEEMK
jgi:Leucine-rich repeat (LRR) protein